MKKGSTDIFAPVLHMAKAPQAQFTFWLRFWNGQITIFFGTYSLALPSLTGLNVALRGLQYLD